MVPHTSQSRSELRDKLSSRRTERAINLWMLAVSTTLARLQRKDKKKKKNMKNDIITTVIIITRGADTCDSWITKGTAVYIN